MPRKKAPTVEEIIELKEELETYYRNWRSQMMEDDKFYNLMYDVAVSQTPDQFETVRPPSATTIVDLIADHAAGNFPNLHVPRRKETASAQGQSTLMEKVGAGFWYRSIQQSPRNILRAWAQSGALRGAIGGSLLYNPDAWPDLPLPSEYGGVDSEEYKEAKEEADALRRTAWPFVLDYEDPLYMLPDPSSEGKDFVIVAFRDKVYEVLRRWPTWDRMLPGTSEPLKLTDEVEFIKYCDDTYRGYVVASIATKSATALGKGIVKHGYGFNPTFFSAGGFGSPFGKPEHKYRGVLTNVRDLLKTEARRMTHLDAIVAQQAFPWIIVQHGVDPDMQLGGVTRVPPGVKPDEAVKELRPVIPIQEIAQELQLIRAAIQRATIPDSLGAEPNKSEESGYLRSLKIGTGRARIRALSNSLERAAAWATSGFYRLVENKVKASVSVWGRGMGEDQEFVTIRPEDIKGHYEVYATLTPSLPNDESVDIRNGIALYEHGAIPIRDLLETYAGRENADELLRERLGEDVFKSPQYQQQVIAEAMGTTAVTGGPIAAPGFTSGQVPAVAPQQTVGPTVQGVPSLPPAAGVPTPASPPSAASQMATVVGRTQRGGLPISDIQR